MMTVFVTQPERLPMNPTGVSDALMRVWGWKASIRLHAAVVLERESFVRRLLAIGAITVAVLAAFALAWQPIIARAASNPGNLTIISAPGPVGCALGPAFTFCDQAPGTTSAAAQFTVQANAKVDSVAVTMSAIPGLSGAFTAGDFTILSNSCTGTLQANQQCQIAVEFSPTTAGLREAQLSVTDSAGDSPDVNLAGTGNNLALAPPAISPGVSDNSYSFGSIQVRPSTPSSQTFTIAAGASITQISIALAPIPGLEPEFANFPSDFSIPPAGNTCGALASGGTCTFTVEFIPSAVGLRSAAVIATDAQGDTSTVYVSGYGSNGNGGAQSGGLVLTAAANGPSAASCSRVNVFGFCNLPVGGISATSTFVLQNTTAAATQITGLTIPIGSAIAQGSTAPDFTVQNTSCSSVLDSGASCNITVAFTPTASGLRQGAIVVTDAQGDVAAVNLAGVGDDYSIAPELPTEVSVIPGGTAKFTATLTPDNVLGMNGEQVTFVCPANLPTNTSCAVTPCPAMITPGTPVTVTVTVVTSSATAVAPPVTAGCSTYGPSIAAFLGAPPTDGNGPRAATESASGGSSTSSALLILAALGAIALLAAAFSAPQIADSRKRVPLILASAAFAAVIFTGCHHHGVTVTTATPTGVTSLKILGSATDASGNSLNTSRSFTVTLDVVTK